MEATIKINMSNFASVDCAYKHARQLQEKRKRKEQKERREAVKSRSQWLKEAQAEFNKFIRLRDAGKACMSCGRNTGAKINAGHYLSVGSHPELRFNELNCNLQCEHCNTYKSGNQALYRIALIDKIGLDKVEWLEGKHEPLKLTIEEIKAIKTKYRQKCKELQKSERAL